MLEGFLPEYILESMKKFNSVQEIRIRLGKPYVIVSEGQEHLFNVINYDEFGQVIKMLTSHSVYAVRENLKNGFITISGGHRVGFCGTCIIRSGEIYHMKDITGINVRIAKEFTGISDEFFIRINDYFDNTLIISPPGCGKTTYLRDIARTLSNNGQNVSVVDERGEIFPYDRYGCVFDNGLRCDVITGSNKSEGIRIVLRVMNPDVIVCAEISTFDDAYAVLNAAASGVKVLASMHGYGISDYNNRIDFKELVNKNFFKYFILLSKRNGVGTIEDIVKK